MVMVFLLAMLFMISEESVWSHRIEYAAIFINLSLLFGGICWDPGVKPETYLHYTKIWYSGGKDLYQNSSDSESAEPEQSSEADIENTHGGPTNRKQER